MDKIILGSNTAKGGFANEKEVCRKFNSWQNDKEAQQWLKIMGYSKRSLSSVTAFQIPIRIKKSDLAELNIDEDEYEDCMRYKKADAQIRIIIKIGNILKVENISLKKGNCNADFNQVDKRSVDTYKEMWGFDDEIAKWLKLFTGESKPNIIDGLEISQRDKRRLFFNEMPESIQNKIINFFEQNRILIVSDVLKGRGGLSANWMLVTRYDKTTNQTTWTLKDINTAMNFFGGGKVEISPKGSLYIGRITVQRKGGTPDPTKLQFKIKPCELFELE